MDNCAVSCSREIQPDFDRVSIDPNKSLYDFDLSVFLRTCNKEIEKPILGQVTFGNVPSWLNGSLIRNGPGGVDKYGKGKLAHLFDAPGLLQKYKLENGELTYTSRFIHGQSYKQNLAAQRLVLSEFGTIGTPDPCQTIFSRLSSLFLSPFESTFSDNASIGIHPFGDEAYSLAEIPFAHRINLENLETLETVNVHNVLGLVHHTAHLHTWADKVYNIGSKLGFSLRPCYVVVEMDATSKLTTSSPFDEPSGKSPWSTAKIVATIPSRWPLKLGYMHSFLITPNYFILVEQPLSIFMPKFAVNQLSRRKPLASSLQFFPDEDTCFYVISRNKANNPQFQVFRAPAFIYFHTINALETKNRDDDDIIIVDISCYDDPSFIDSMYVEALENAQSNPDYAKMLHGRPKRFTLNCTSGQITESKIIVDIGCELPKINSVFVGKPYNYFYAMCADIDANNPGKLIKVDVVKNTFKTWFEPNAFTSEPIFVPAPNSKVIVILGEDDGVLMSILLYGGESRIGPNRSTLVIINAKSWEAIAKVDILSESAIPKCLHGWFFPDEHFKEKVTQDEVTVS